MHPIKPRKQPVRKRIPVRRPEDFVTRAHQETISIGIMPDAKAEPAGIFPVVSLQKDGHIWSVKSRRHEDWVQLRDAMHRMGFDAKKPKSKGSGLNRNFFEISKLPQTSGAKHPLIKGDHLRDLIARIRPLDAPKKEEK